ncbi:MAG TPA: ferric reductase-like transmembrane domain-containing protein [Candidatus Limnocylindrales bacterium]
MNDTVLWYATRGAGIVSLLLFTAVVVLGILQTLRWQTASWPRFLTAGLHRNLALLSVAFLAVHIVTAVVDPYTALGPLAALVPFSSPYRRLWLGLGVVAFDLLLALVLTSLVRVRLGHRAWRAVHWLAYAAWPVALLHGAGTGSDTGALWMRLLDATCVVLVVGATTMRLTFERQALDRPPAAPAWVGSTGRARANGRED